MGNRSAGICRKSGKIRSNGDASVVAHSQGVAGGPADFAWKAVRLCRACAAQKSNQAELGSDRLAQDRRQPGGKLSGTTGIGQRADGGAAV